MFFFYKNWAKIKKNRKKHVFRAIFKKVEKPRFSRNIHKKKRKKTVFHGIYKKIEKNRFSRNFQKNWKKPFFAEFPKKLKNPSFSWNFQKKIEKNTFFAEILQIYALLFFEKKTRFSWEIWVKLKIKKTKKKKNNKKIFKKIRTGCFKKPGALSLNGSATWQFQPDKTKFSKIKLGDIHLILNFPITRPSP